MPLQPELDIWIRNAEDRWFSALGQYLEEVFSDTFLPSHDHTHHLRVWNIARSLLEHISTFNKHLDPSLVEGLIIAVMFHDAGMVVTREKEHGRISRERCESFFRDRKLQRPERFEEVLEAIEKHDNKDDRIYFGITPDEPPDLLTLLSLADDLDALGVIGVYRYAEICLVRGMSMRELGVNILGNVSARFNHISKSCAMCPQILRVYREKYTYLVSFYDSYNQQLLLESDPQEVRSGYLGVVNAIRRLTLEGKTRPEDLPAKVEKNDPGKLVIDFFSQLKAALEGERSK